VKLGLDFYGMMITLHLFCEVHPPTTGLLVEVFLCAKAQDTDIPNEDYAIYDNVDINSC
jgi:hypothetical protein